MKIQRHHKPIVLIMIIIININHQYVNIVMNIKNIISSCIQVKYNQFMRLISLYETCSIKNR